MTYKDFIQQLARLDVLKGQDVYSGERLDNIFNAAQYLDNKTLDQIITHMLMNYNKLPLPSEFVALIKSKIKLQPKETEKIEYKKECERCADVGVLNAIKECTNENYFILCDCKKAEEISKTMESFVDHIWWYTPNIETTLGYKITKYNPKPRVLINEKNIVKESKSVLISWKKRLQDSNQHWKNLDSCITEG